MINDKRTREQQAEIDVAITDEYSEYIGDTVCCEENAGDFCLCEEDKDEQIRVNAIGRYRISLEITRLVR